VTFVESIGGVKYAAYVFHWGHAGVQAYKSLQRHVGDEALTELNLSTAGVDDGLAVLKAMQDGGWKGYGMPKLVRHALSSIHHQGMSYAKIAKMTGLTPDQVQWATGRKGLDARRSRVVANAALGVG
jgi:hypothetical protein